MKKVFLCIALLIMSVLFIACGTKEKISEPGILYQNANVITMEKDGVQKNTDVLVVDGKIVKVGKKIKVQQHEVVDCTDKYIMPGLFDMHMHIWNSEVAPLFIANGITSVRNMKGSPMIEQLNSMKEKGLLVSPTIYTSSPLIDGVKSWFDATVVTTPEEGEKLVRGYASYGYKQIKVYPSIPKDTLLRMFEVANELEIKLVGHSNRFVTQRELADLGFYSFEHSAGLPEDKEDVAYMAKSGAWFCPTQVVHIAYDYSSVPGNDITQVKNYEYVPRSLRQYWQQLIDSHHQNYKPDSPKYQEKYIEYAKEYIKNSNKILAGTDVGNPGLVPGFSLHDELWELVNTFGMSNFDALKAATVNGAEHLEITEQKGMIKAGLDGDLLILTANPLEDISNTTKIDMVILGGTQYDRGALDAMLEEMKQMQK